MQTHPKRMEWYFQPPFKLTKPKYRTSWRMWSKLERQATVSSLLDISSARRRRRLLDFVVLLSRALCQPNWIINGTFGAIGSGLYYVAVGTRRWRYTRVSFEKGGFACSVSVTDQRMCSSHFVRFILALKIQSHIRRPRSLIRCRNLWHHYIIHYYILSLSARQKSTFMAGRPHQNKKRVAQKNTKDYYICMCGRGRVGCPRKKREGERGRTDGNV